MDNCRESLQIRKISLFFIIFLTFPFVSRLRIIVLEIIVRYSSGVALVCSRLVKFEPKYIPVCYSLHV